MANFGEKLEITYLQGRLERMEKAMDDLQEQLKKAHAKANSNGVRREELEKENKDLNSALEREKRAHKFWKRSSAHNGQQVIYYRDELAKAHALLGRVVHQASERWDALNLSRYFPTDNPNGRRSPRNPAGKPPKES